MSRVRLYNSFIKIDNPTSPMRSGLSKQLSYVDKSKQYLVKRMSKNIFRRSSPDYERLKSEVDNCLLIEEEDGSLTIPSGFAHLIKQFDCDIEDNRHETGKEISLPWISNDMAVKLRQYQEIAVDECIKNWRGIINLATGLGKTLTAVALIRKLRRKTLIICPNVAIAEQFYDELCKRFGSNRIGFCGDGRFKINDITVGVAQTVINHVDRFSTQELGVIIYDEAHHVAANTFISIAKSLSNVGRMYGLTATAYRSDGKDIVMTSACGDTLIQHDAAWGVKNGWLAKPYFLVREVKTNGYDYKDDRLKSYKAHILKSKEMLDRIESDALKMISTNKSTVILVDTIEHGTQLSKKLGIPFAKGEDEDSSLYFKLLNDGKIPGLVATDGKAGEGVDLRNVDVLILANFTAAKGAVLQAVGRGLRMHGTKDSCIILDYIPTGSSMLKRHAMQRVGYYREITNQIKIIKLTSSNNIWEKED